MEKPRNDQEVQEQPTKPVNVIDFNQYKLRKAYSEITLESEAQEVERQNLRIYEKRYDEIVAALEQKHLNPRVLFSALIKLSQDGYPKAHLKALELRAKKERKMAFPNLLLLIEYAIKYLQRNSMSRDRLSEMIMVSDMLDIAQENNLIPNFYPSTEMLNYQQCLDLLAKNFSRLYLTTDLIENYNQALKDEINCLLLNLK